VAHPVHEMATTEPIRLSLARPAHRPDETPLFRAEAVQSAREPLHGPVTLVMPPSAFAGAGLSVIALAMLALAAFIVEVPQRTAAVGVLMPPDGFTRIVAETSGQVIDVNVAAGDRVEAGQPLLSVSADRSVINHGTVSSNQLRSLWNERRLLGEAHMRRQRMHSERLDAVAGQLDSLELRLELLGREMQIQDSRSTLLSSRLDRLHELAASGNFPAVQLDDHRLALLSEEAVAAALQQRAAQLAEERDELARARVALVEEAETRQIEFAIALEQLQRQIASLEASVSSELQAPASGLVARVTVRAGQAVRPGQTLVTLQRGESDLEAWLYLSSANAGLIRAGQEVQLRLDSYPHQMFGTLPATVATISHVALLPSDLDVPLAISGPVFELRATLDAQHINALERDWPLAAGTSVRADVVQRRYRLYEWLLRLRQVDNAHEAPADA
jgi:membrane fusion protein